MMTIEIKNRMYRNIALLIFLLLTSIVVAFANETQGEPQNEKAHVVYVKPS